MMISRRSAISRPGARATMHGRAEALRNEGAPGVPGVTRIGDIRDDTHAPMEDAPRLVAFGERMAALR